jgi:hypothetical protein
LEPVLVPVGFWFKGVFVVRRSVFARHASAKNAKKSRKKNQKYKKRTGRDLRRREFGQGGDAAHYISRCVAEFGEAAEAKGQGGVSASGRRGACRRRGAPERARPAPVEHQTVAAQGQRGRVGRRRCCRARARGGRCHREQQQGKKFGRHGGGQSVVVGGGGGVLSVFQSAAALVSLELFALFVDLVQARAPVCRLLVLA